MYSLLSALAVLAVILTGCGNSVAQKASEKALENAIEKETGGQAKVDINNNNYKVESKDGKIEVGQNVNLPDGFPKDVYVIGGNIISAFSEPTKESFTVSIEISMNLSEAAALYQEKLKGDGWQITGNMSYGDITSVIAEKADRTATVMISKSSDKTTVVLNTGKK
jgi:hypothetical protein